MKFENNWRHKTLENLEKEIWSDLEKSESSHLIKTCHSLRKKQLKDFSVEDLRIMIGQDIGLPFLIPLAIEILSDNILSEGDYYEGDLLRNVLTSDVIYWQTSKESWVTVCNLFEKNRLMVNNLDTTSEIKKSLFDSYKEFKKINAQTV